MTAKYGFVREQDREFPPMVIVDMTNVCNLSCSHCAHPVIKKLPGYKAGFMKLDVFCNIVDQVAGEDILLFRVASDGESIMHPQFFKMMTIAKEAGIKPLNLTTNGMFLREDEIQKILACGMDVVDVSIDAFTEETYKKIRIGGDFERVKQGVLDLVKARDAAGSPLKIFVSIINQPLSVNEIKPFVDFWESRVNFVLVRNLCDEVGLVETQGQEEVVLPERYPCPQFWKRVTINHRGDLRFCVEDWENKGIVANIAERSIKDIWKGQEYELMRKQHLEGRFDEIALCSKCIDWAAQPWDQGYEKIIERNVPTSVEIN